MDNSEKAAVVATAKEKDPVCGMTVDPATARPTHQHAGKTYYFCCVPCREKFQADPERFLKPQPPASGLVTLGSTKSSTSAQVAPQATAPVEIQASLATQYVCPMCPEVRE